jgi:hypothetical protein
MTDMAYEQKQAYAAQERQRLEQEQQFKQQRDAYVKEFQDDVGQMVADGYDKFGRDEFNDVKDRVGAALGATGDAFLDVVRKHKIGKKFLSG